MRAACLIDPWRELRIDIQVVRVLVGLLAAGHVGRVIVAARLRTRGVDRAASLIQERALDVAPHPFHLAQILQSRAVRAHLRVDARLLLRRKGALYELQDGEDFDGANIDAEMAAPRTASATGKR